MTDLAPIFERLGLLNYLNAFVEEGFESWETVLYITESDLEALNVKLGHRRKLQKEIAHARGISIDQVIGSGARNPPGEEPQNAESDTKSIASHGEGRSTSGPSKRKYRRHPKPDENAPERAPSAYVIFSNRIREELRPHKLSFTEIAKTVGERWQELKPEEKEQYESQAAAAKEVYNSELAKYKRTGQYREYMRYLADFKARNAPNTTEGKRLKLETEGSNASSGSAASFGISREASNVEHHHKDCTGQSGYSPTCSSVNSPTGSLARYMPASLESTQSSQPPTPIAAGAKQSMPSHAGQGSRGFEPPRAQHLPRIMSLEARDGPLPHRMLMNDPAPSFGSNPRRSATNSPASLIRHDTSKSSTSSNISGGSGTSTAPAYATPVTPADDFRPSRSLPLPPTMLGKPSTTAAASLPEIARPPLPPSVSQASVGCASTTPAQAGYPQSFHHLNIGHDTEGDGRRSRSHLGHREPIIPQREQNNNVRSASTHQHYQVSGHPMESAGPNQGANNQGPPSRWDALSVLAIAGRLMDHHNNTENSRESRDR